MPAKLTQSFRLEKLWDRIVIKDGQSEAMGTFQGVTARYFDWDDYSMYELIEAAQELEGEYFAFEVDEILYLFDEPTEAKAYNAVLRQWCANTGRLIKTKKSSKK